LLLKSPELPEELEATATLDTVDVDYLE
jgi:hypothetical protein